MGREGARLSDLRRRRRALSSPIAKFLGEQEARRLRCEPGHTVLFAADAPAMVSRVLGALRLQLGRELELIDEQAQRFLWVTEFPMFEWDADNGRWDAVHHPFTRPTSEGEALLDSDPAAAKALAYDPGRERDRDRRRLLPDSRARVAGQACSGCSTSPPRAAAFEVRLPARRARDGRTAARRDRLRHRPVADGAARRALHPRAGRVPGKTRPESTPASRSPDDGRAGPAEGASGIAVYRREAVSEPREACVPRRRSGRFVLEALFLAGVVRPPSPSPSCARWP